MSIATVREAAVVDRREALAHVADRLGGIPVDRIVRWPPPGTATDEDLLREPRLCELVDGVLVEKPMATFESLLAIILVRILGPYLDVHDLGIVVGEAGLQRLAPGLVRAPDVSFISWDQFAGRKRPREAIFSVFPDLAVEVLSPTNTEKEMARKRGEYFAAGTRLMWIMDPESVTVQVWTSPVDCSVRTVDDVLDGGDVLPGFRVSIREWVERAWPAEE
jgi:Uma2 family endonuclease